MATQSPKTRKTKTTKKPSASAKTTTKATPKKVVKTAPKTAKKPVVAAATTIKAPRKKISTVFRRNRGASIKAPKAPTASVKAVSLAAWNKWLALLFAVQGLVILLLSEAHSLPVVGHYLALDTFASQGQDEVRVTAQQHLFDINIVYWLAGISFVFMIGHLLAATALRPRYDAQITAGASKLRWITYIFGYGGLLLLFALLVGVNDVVTLALIMLLNVLWGVLALSAEQSSRRSLRVLVATASLAVWAILGYYLLNAWLYDGSIPAYQYALLGITFLLSLQVGRVFASQQKATGKWADYLYAERAYMAWTFVLVVAATWQIFLGVLEP